MTGFLDKKRNQHLLIGVVLAGFLAHGQAMFNVFARAETLYKIVDLDSVAEIQSGRWFGAFLQVLVKLIIGGNYCDSTLNVVISFFFLFLSASIIICLFNIQNNVIIFFLGFIMTSFPVITSLFYFMFTAAYYSFALFLSVSGAALICKSKQKMIFLVGCFLLTCSMGIYQAYLPVALTIMVLYMLFSVYTEDYSWKRYIVNGARFLFSGLVIILIYFLMVKVSCALCDVSLGDYKGISSMGQEGINTYLYRVLVAFYVWFIPERPYSANMFFGFLIILYRIMQIILVAYLIIMLVNSWKVRKAKSIQLLVLAFFLPLCVNFVFVMAAPEMVNSLCVYAEVMWFVCLACVLEKVALPSNITRYLYTVVVLLFGFFSLTYTKYANDAYLKAELIKMESICYMNTISSQIKSVEGYTEETPVVFIGELDDSTLNDLSELEYIKVNSYRETWKYADKYVMNTWVGFIPIEGDPKEFYYCADVNDMPCYPDEGSIQMVNDTVIVKFGEIKK